MPTVASSSGRKGSGWGGKVRRSVHTVGDYSKAGRLLFMISKIDSIFPTSMSEQSG